MGCTVPRANWRFRLEQQPRFLLDWWHFVILFLGWPVKSSQPKKTSFQAKCWLHFLRTFFSQEHRQNSGSIPCMATGVHSEARDRCANLSAAPIGGSESSLRPPSSWWETLTAHCLDASQKLRTSSGGGKVWQERDAFSWDFQGYYARLGQEFVAWYGFGASPISLRVNHSCSCCTRCPWVQTKQ